MVPRNTKNEDWTWLNNSNSAKRGTLLKTSFSNHELNGIFEASVLSGSGIPPIPHSPHSLHGSNGSGFANRVWKNETRPYKYSLVFISESPHTMPVIHVCFIFFPSFSPDVNGDIVKVAVHVFITMIRHHHLIICVLLLPYSSSFPRSSAVATLVSYWFSIFVSKVHFFQQEIYVCNDLCFKRSSRWGQWTFDALWLLHWWSQGLFLRLLGSTMFDPPS